MALIDCSNCDSRMSVLAKTCPKCGHPNDKLQSNDVSAAQLVFETLCSNYHEKRRLHYRVVLSYIVSGGAVIFFLEKNNVFLEKLSLFSLLAVTFLFFCGFTGSCLVWLWRLEKSMQSNVVEICQLRHLLLVTSYDKETVLNLTAIKREYKPSQWYFYCQVASISAVSLFIVGLFWSKNFNFALFLDEILDFLCS